MTATLSVEAPHARLAVVPESEALRLEGVEGAVVSGIGTDTVIVLLEPDRLPAASTATPSAALVLGGLNLAQLLRAEAVAGRGLSHKAVIMIFLPGGPTHLDTYDMKPQAPVEFRGELRPIRTNVPGPFGRGATWWPI